MKKDNVVKFPVRSEVDTQYELLEKQREMIELQAKVISMKAKKKKERTQDNGSDT